MVIEYKAFAELTTEQKERTIAKQFSMYVKQMEKEVPEILHISRGIKEEKSRLGLRKYQYTYDAKNHPHTGAFVIMGELDIIMKNIEQTDHYLCKFCSKRGLEEVKNFLSWVDLLTQKKASVLLYKSNFASELTVEMLENLDLQAGVSQQAFKQRLEFLARTVQDPSVQQQIKKIQFQAKFNLEAGVDQLNLLMRKVVGEQKYKLKEFTMVLESWFLERQEKIENTLKQQPNNQAIHHWFEQQKQLVFSADGNCVGKTHKK